MSLKAYYVESVVDSFPRKIESLCLWEGQILAALQDGSLLFFRCSPQEGDDAAGLVKWQVSEVGQAAKLKP